MDAGRVAHRREREVEQRVAEREAQQPSDDAIARRQPIFGAATHETDDEERRRGEEAVAGEQALDGAVRRRIADGGDDRPDERPGSRAERNGALRASADARLRKQQEREGSAEQRGERGAAGRGEKQVVEDGGPRAQMKSQAGLFTGACREAVRQVKSERVAEREPLEERER